MQNEPQNLTEDDKRRVYKITYHEYPRSDWQQILQAGLAFCLALFNQREEDEKEALLEEMHNCDLLGQSTQRRRCPICLPCVEIARELLNAAHTPYNFIEPHMREIAPGQFKFHLEISISGEKIGESDCFEDKAMALRSTHSILKRQLDV